MDEALRTLLALFSAASILVIFGTIAAKRTYLFLAIFMLAVNIVLRMSSLATIDLFGPIYSEQLGRNVGPGFATPIYAAAYICVLIPIWVVLSPAVVRPLAARSERRGPLPDASITLADLVFGLSLIYVLALYVDMARSGVVPFIDKIERYDYTRQYAGMVHRLFMENGYFLIFTWGFFCAHTWVRNHRPDMRFVGLLVATWCYLFLAGHRFSAFYSFTSFFILPLGAVLMGGRTLLPHQGQRAMSSRLGKALVVGAIFGVALVVGALLHSYFVVRAMSDANAAFKLTQRLFVQPSELAWLTYERVFVEGLWNQEATALNLFWHPIDATRNTTIQYLMVLALGYDTAARIIAQNSQYAGGFPEIYFELFGPYLAWPLLVLAGAITAALLLLILRATAEGHFLTAFFAFYVLFGVIVMYIGGMLNFVTTWTYWVKLGALFASILIERSWARRGVDFLPWIIIPRRQAQRLSA